MKMRAQESEQHIEKLTKEFKTIHPTALKQIKELSEQLNIAHINTPFLNDPGPTCQYFRDITADIIVAANRVLRMEWKGSVGYISYIPSFERKKKL